MQFKVMWSGMANELWPNGVNPGICTHAEVHNVMDHEAGEMFFFIFLMLWNIISGK